MWIDEARLRVLGFRRKSEGYWSCFRRFGLRGDEHLSIFARTELAPEDRRGTRTGLIVEITEFHVTLPVGENLHFYYHEADHRSWTPGGHTSPAEIRRLGLEPLTLRERADRIAGAFVFALGGSILEWSR